MQQKTTNNLKQLTNMITIETILSRLTEGVLGTDKELFTYEERNQFALYYFNEYKEWNDDELEEIMSSHGIAEAFTGYWWDTNRTCRRCTECGRLFREGYCVEGGCDYYCSDECLHKHYTDEEWAEECENNDQSYWTEW